MSSVLDSAPVDRGGDDDEHKVVGEFGVDADREVGSSTRRRVAVRQRRGQQRCGRRLRQPQVVCGIICHYQLLLLTRLVYLRDRVLSP